jgi:hypothetical protein
MKRKPARCTTREADKCFKAQAYQSINLKIVASV